MNAIRYATGLFAGALLLATALPAQAQIDDNRWLPFIGCWEAVDGPDDAGLLCFRPTTGGVEMSSIAAGEVVATEVLAADGQARPVSAEGCEGSESVSFSADGRRAFTRTAFVCDGESRSGSGIMAIVSPSRWVDVRALEVNGETVAWVQAYGLVGVDRLAEEGVSDPILALPMTVRGARLAAAQGLDLDDVIEASARVDEKAVVAWIAAEQDPFDVHGDDLLRLADRGVPESVIDVVVAVTYPERFVVAPEQAIAQAEPEFSGRRIPMSVGYRSYMMFDPFYGPAAWGYGFSPYAFGGFGYRYGGYGYGYPGYGYSGYGGYGYGPTIIRVERRRPESGGRAVRGRGYTRGARGGDGVARPSGGASSGGYTGSSGAQPTRSATPRRKAKPRGGSW